MKISIGNTTIYKAFIIIILILDLNFFYLIKQPAFLIEYNTRYNKSLITAIVLFVFAMFFITHLKYISKYKYIKLISFCFTFSALIVFIYSAIAFPDQSFKNTFSQCYYYLIIFLAFPIMYIFESEQSVDSIFKWLNIITLIWYVVLIIQSIIFKNYGALILKDIKTTDGFINTRFGSFRNTLFPIGNIMILYNFYRIYNVKNISVKKAILIIQLLLGMYCLLFIQQTRMFTIAIFIGLFFIILSNSTAPLKVIRNLAIIAIAIIILINTGYISNLLSSFSSNSEIYYSTATRIGEFKYYWKCWLSNPLFGNGFASGNAYFYLIHGPIGTYYYSDMGILGLMCQMGILGMTSYLIMLIRELCVIIKIYMQKKQRQHSFTIAVFSYVIFTTPTLIVTSSPFIVMLPFIIAIFEYSAVRCEADKKDGVTV